MNRKRIAIVLITAGVLTLLYQLFLKPSAKKEEEKPTSIAVKKHSVAFNSSVEKLMQHYFELKDAFVEADTVAVKASAQNFVNSLNTIDTVELKKDTASIYNTVIFTLSDMKLNAESILNQHDIKEMRRDFSSLTDMMYPAFFQAIHYEGPTVYLQNCPMAFDDSIAANWISNSAAIVNPYLGKKHPEYKATMLHCGELKDSVSFK